MNLNDIKDPTKRKAFESVIDYDGVKFDDIATEITNISIYNRNYYRLPNGTVVFVETDEFYEVSEIFVVDSENPKDIRFRIHVGYLEEDFKNYCERINLTTEVYT